MQFWYGWNSLFISYPAAWFKCQLPSDISWVITLSTDFAISSLVCRSLWSSMYTVNKGLSSQSYGFSSSRENWIGLYRKLSAEELIGAFELWCWRRLGSPLDSKEIQPVHSKGNQSWIFMGRTDAEAETPNTLATWCEELIHLKRPWCWERLKAGGERDDGGWDTWIVSPTQWT